ncbi:MAG: alpha/beta fold hydrolase [Chloroflexi bacterium]|nr:MAG: alpha/beta fold hydrolase [Chloroflexota bacterium]
MNPTVHVQQVAFRSGSFTLSGYLYRPQRPGPLPAVIFNHGSSREYDEHVDLAPLFTSRGYAFFFPFRRGHGRSEGPYVGDILDRARTRSDADWSRALVDQMGAQVEDQLSAIAYLSSLALVDPQRIVAIGSSFGGIQSTLIAESASIRGSVSFAASICIQRAGAALVYPGGERLRSDAECRACRGPRSSREGWPTDCLSRCR